MKLHLPKMLGTALRNALSNISFVSVATGTLAAILLAGTAPQAAAASPYIWTAAESNVWDTTALNWTQDGTPAAFKSGSSSAVTFGSNAKSKNVTIDSTLTAGAMLVNGAFTFSGTGKLTVASLNGASPTIKVEEGLTITSGGTTTVDNGSMFTASGDGALSLTTIKVGGQAKFSGSNVTITGGGNGQGSTNRALGLCLNANGEVTISGGTTTVKGATYLGKDTKLEVGNGLTAATLITTRLEVGDSNNTGDTSSVTIRKNGKIVVTGSVNTTSYQDSSIVFSEWGNTSTVDVYGDFYAQGAEMRSGNLVSEVTFYKGSTVAVKGFSQISDKSATKYTVEEGARIIVGASGITQNNGTDGFFKISNAELGISAATVNISTNLEASEGSITFNTNQYTWGADKASVTQGTTAGTITVSGAISGGGIKVIGNGTVNLSAANTYKSTTTIESGTLRVTGKGTLGEGNGTVLVKNGTLSVEKDLDLSHNGLTISTAGTVKVNSGKKLTVGVASINKAIQNSGTVIFSNKLTVKTDGLNKQHDAAGYVDEQGNPNDHQGFRQGSTDYVQVVEGGTTVDNGARFTYKGEEVTFDAATARAIVSTSEDTDWTTYELRDGNAHLADIISYAEGHRGVTFSTIDMYGGDLQVAVDFSRGTVNVNGAGNIGADTSHTIGTVNVYSTGEDGLNFNQTGTPVGALNVLGSSTIKGNVAPRNFTVGNEATATVQAGVVANNLSVEQGSTILLDNNASRLTAFNGTVDGTVNVNAQGAFYLGIVGTGSGTVNVNGRVDVAAGGTLDIRQGSKLMVGGRLHLASGANYTEGGTLQVTSTGELVAGNAIQLGALDVKGRLSVEGEGATVNAKGGAISTLNISAGQTLNVDGALTLQSITGEDGNLTVSGALTVPANLHLDNVTAGSVALTTSGSLTVDNALNTESVTLGRINREKVYLTAGSLTASTTDFVVNVDTVESLRLSDGMTLTLADVTSAITGAVTVNGGSTISKAGSDYAYTISQDEATKDIILTAHEKESEYIWLGTTNDWTDGANWSGGNAPETGSWVQLRADKHDAGAITINSQATVNRVTAYQDTAHTLTGEGSLAIAGRLEILNSEIQVGSGSDSFQMQAASTRLTDGSVLRVNDGATFATGSLSSDGTGATIAGDIMVYGSGGVYRGAYDNVHITMTQLPSSPAAINQTLAADGGLSVEGYSGSVTFLYGSDAHLGGLETNAMTVVLNSQTEDAVGKHLVLDSAAAITKGALVFGLDPESTAATLGTGKAPVVLTAAGGLDLTDSELIIGQGGSYSKGALVIDTDQTEDLVLAYVGDEATQAGSVSLVGKLFNKYYTNARLVNGAVLVDLRSGYFAQDVVPSGDENVRTGATMLDEALKYTNPQVNDPEGELAGIMDALESGKLASGNAEKIAAGLAGASTAALGLAASADVDRQLRAIRNRTTTMGVGEGADRKGMPYINAWVNAEGDYRKLSADGMLAGYKMTSWGGTLGLDVDCTPRFTCGLAVTAMYGDFTANSAEEADGDLDRTYITAFAHYTHRSWSHTLIGTIGRFDTKLSRSINYGRESAATEGESDGTGFGLMYELGYTRALNESGTTAIQPVFNVSWRHSSLGGYTETGSQTALTVGDADADVVTFALGARLQSAYGAQPCNRSSLFEGRVLAKLATGDKDVQTKVNLSGLPTHTAKSAETGSFGVEVGAGLAIPMLRDTDTLFFDLSAEFWSGYTNVNGVVGYRVNF